MPDTITLTPEQIRAPADFAAQEGQPSYTITTGIIRLLRASLNIRG
ncbi:hypothetical protein ACSHFC_003949 [Morganella morganii]|nr:hypothetical protein [Morganella morganii]